MHESVLLNESVEALNIVENGVYVDATFGAGGHSKEILKKLGNEGRLIAFDRDCSSKKLVLEDSRFQLVNANYRFLEFFLDFLKIDEVDGILADLGLSSMQLDEERYGMAFRLGGVLDMRMNQRQELDAQFVVNHYSEQELQMILSSYGELTNSADLASSIVSARKLKSIETIEEFKTIMLSNAYGNRNKFLAKVFQAIRIEVNEEMNSLRQFLLSGAKRLKQGGRFAVISFHSLEDRPIKYFFREGRFDDNEERYKELLSVVNRKPILASREEQKRNNRSRSAKLRVAQKI